MPQEKDSFQKAWESHAPPEESTYALTPAAAPAAPQWVQDYERMFPGQAAAWEQMRQIPGDIGSVVGGVLPTLAGLLHSPAQTIGGMITGTAQGLYTPYQGTKALMGQLPMVSGGPPVAPNVPFPTQEELSQSRQLGLGMLGSAALSELPGAVRSTGASELGRAAGHVFQYGLIPGVLRYAADVLRRQPETPPPTAPPPTAAPVSTTSPTAATPAPPLAAPVPPMLQLGRGGTRGVPPSTAGRGGTAPVPQPVPPVLLAGRGGIRGIPPRGGKP